MPQLSSEQAEDRVYGGSSFTNSRQTLRERLTERFAAHEWVRVINPDDEDYYWQYLPQYAETIEFSQDGMQKIVHREPVEAWVLHPGESEVILGENAYVMIDGLYKKLVAKGYLQRNGSGAKDTPGRNFNWSDGRQQDELIELIFLGKETPEFKSKANVRNQAPNTPRLTATPRRLGTAS